MAERLAGEDRVAWLAVDDHGRAIGVVVVELLGKCTHVGESRADCTISYLAVRPDARGRGHGGRLAAHAVSELAARDGTLAYLDVECSKPDSIGFWRSRGWTKADEYHKGEAHILQMIKSLHQ